MNDVTEQVFLDAILVTHGASANYLETVEIEDYFEGAVVWTGQVLVFELIGHPDATRCYAWEVGGEVIAVLGVGPIESAADAVRASILAAGGPE